MPAESGYGGDQAAGWDRGECRRGRGCAAGAGSVRVPELAAAEAGSWVFPWHMWGDHFYPFILRPLPSAIPALTHPAISEMSL